MFYFIDERQPCGIYGSQTSGASNTVTGFSGAGRLIVGEIGLMIKVR